MSGYTMKRLDEIEELHDGRCPYRPVRHELGIRAFGVNSWTARDAGDRIINEHGEDQQDGDEELYVVLRGHATFELDGESVEAPEGTLVFVPPGVKRTAFAAEAETTVLAIGGPAGKPYEPSGWELWAPAQPLYERKDYAAAIELIAPVAEAHPGYAGLMYNLACVESLAGRRDDALEHLGRAVTASPRFRSLAREDSDFDPIRGDPAFGELVEETEPAGKAKGGDRSPRP